MLSEMRLNYNIIFVIFSIAGYLNNDIKLCILIPPCSSIPLLFFSIGNEK